mgnify:CR=1 FL=1
MQSIRQVFNVAKTKLTSDIEEKDFREESVSTKSEHNLSPVHKMLMFHRAWFCMCS